MKEIISDKILLYNPETGKHESITAIRGESAYEAAVRLGYTTLTEEQWIKEHNELTGQVEKLSEELVNLDKNKQPIGDYALQVEVTEKETALTDKINAEIIARQNAVATETNRAMAKETELEELFSMPTQEAIDKWLSEHPEATTTVLDDSLTSGKFAPEMKAYFPKSRANYVHDETADFATKINELLSVNGITEVFVPIGNYTVSDTIHVPDSKILRLSGDYKTDKANYATLEPANAGMNVIELGIGSVLMGGHISLGTHENTNAIYMPAYKVQYDSTRVDGTKITGGRQSGILTQRGVCMQMDDPDGLDKSGYLMFCEFDCEIRNVYSAYDAVRTLGGTLSEGLVWATACRFYGQLYHCNKYVNLACDADGYQFNKSDIDVMIQAGNIVGEDEPACTITGSNIKINAEFWDFNSPNFQQIALYLDEVSNANIIYNYPRSKTVIDLGKDNLFVSDVQEANSSAPITNSFLGNEQTFHQTLAFFDKNNEEIDVITDVESRKFSSSIEGEKYTLNDGTKVWELNLLRGFNYAIHVNPDAPDTPCLSKINNVYKCIYDIEFDKRHRIDYVGFNTGNLTRFRKISIYFKTYKGDHVLVAEHMGQLSASPAQAWYSKIYRVQNFYYSSDTDIVASKSYPYVGIRYVMEEPEYSIYADGICPLVLPFFYSTSFTTTKRSSRFIGDAFVGNKSIIYPVEIPVDEIGEYIDSRYIGMTATEDGVAITKKDDTVNVPIDVKPANQLIVLDIELLNRGAGYTVLGGIAIAQRATKTHGMYALYKDNLSYIASENLSIGDTLAVIRGIKVWNLENETDLHMYGVASDYYATHQI